jgi:hypothetical protein
MTRPGTVLFKTDDSGRYKNAADVFHFFSVLIPLKTFNSVFLKERSLQAKQSGSFRDESGGIWKKER